MGMSEQATLDWCHAQFMAEPYPGHWNHIGNILDPRATRMGVGIATVGGTHRHHLGLHELTSGRRAAPCGTPAIPSPQSSASPCPSPLPPAAAVRVGAGATLADRCRARTGRRRPRDRRVAANGDDRHHRASPRPWLRCRGRHWRHLPAGGPLTRGEAPRHRRVAGQGQDARAPAGRRLSRRGQRRATSGTCPRTPAKCPPRSRTSPGAAWA